MPRHWLISGVTVLVTAILAFLIAVYPEQIRQLISSTLNLPDVTIVFYILVCVILLVLGGSIVYISLLIYAKFKFDVVIQEKSLRFNKYPYFIVYPDKREQKMPNTAYAEITIENRGKKKVNECEVEITLKKKGVEIYRSKVLSSDSTKEPNPITISIDAKGTKGFHPLCLNLNSFVAFLPNHPLGVGVFSGTLVSHGEYEIFGRVMYDGKFGKLSSLGKINIPNDFVNKAKIPNDIQVTIDQGGFAVYAEFYQGRIRAKFYGHNNEGDVRRTLKHLEKDNLQIDNMIEDNGKLRNRPSGVFFFG